MTAKWNLAISLACLGFAIAGVAASARLVEAGADGYVLLVPDSRNDAVYEITPSGEYLGDFLAHSRESVDPALPRLWSSPRALLRLDGDVDCLWLAAERSLTKWSMDGRYLETIYADTVELEDPAGIVRIGDEIFVLSEDKSRVMVFDTAGRHTRNFGYDMLQSSKDMKVGPDGKLWIGGQMFGGRPGLVSVWDPSATAESKPTAYRIPPDMTASGTWWLSSLAFDDQGNALVTEYSRGRLERWDMAKNERTEVLMDRGRSGAYRKLATGPDGLIYLAGADGIYRFAADAHAADLKDLEPFFRASSIPNRYKQAFTPTSMSFVPRSALTALQADASDRQDP